MILFFFVSLPCWSLTSRQPTGLRNTHCIFLGLISGEHHVLSCPYLSSPPVVLKAERSAGKGKLVSEDAGHDWISDDYLATIRQQKGMKRKQDVVPRTVPRLSDLEGVPADQDRAHGDHYRSNNGQDRPTTIRKIRT